MFSTTPSKIHGKRFQNLERKNASQVIQQPWNIANSLKIWFNPNIYYELLAKTDACKYIMKFWKGAYTHQADGKCIKVILGF